MVGPDRCQLLVASWLHARSLKKKDARTVRPLPVCLVRQVSKLRGRSAASEGVTEEGVALVAQVTAHDPLKLDTERWVKSNQLEIWMPRNPTSPVQSDGV